MRHLLLGLITIGAVTTGVGLTGVIAPATDDARTGRVTKEFVETGQFPPLVDLQLAERRTSGGIETCGPFTDNLETGLFDYQTGSSRSFNRVRTEVCVRNRGTEPTAISVSPIDMTLTDLVCTPDETYEEAAQTLSGCNGANPNGFNLRWDFDLVAADSDPTCPPINSFNNYLRPDGASGPGTPGMPAGGVVCVFVFGLYSPPGGLPDSAQTDRLEWRFRFVAA